MILCSYHVTYAFQSESPLCSCLKFPIVVYNWPVWLNGWVLRVLQRVCTSKMRCSFGDGFKSAFYGTFYLVKGPKKIEHNRFNLLDIIWSIFIYLLHLWYLLLHVLLDLMYKGYIVLCVFSFDIFWFAVFPHCHFLSNILNMVRYYLLHFHMWAELCCWRVILKSKWSCEKKIHNKISVTWN